ncbi:hypothetical protein NE235_03470 [Actinoallomurus spadix]|uniref:Lipoprotein n=1 Tax=Actinoallomurus spadix TaxID=79912 RepID=A0ABP3HFU0_9ACTN|nr:hypothetical protein [Actinoallomurus spadix]MCO5985165.1 hypothetical protein [Actinoallomurus spadix]
MSRNRRRAAAMAIAGAFAVAPLVSACGAGQHPQSVLPTRLTEGVNASVGHIDVRNAFLLGPDPGQRLPKGANAPFYASIVEKGSAPDRLVGIEATGLAASAQIAGGGIDLPPNQLISLNPLSAGRPTGVPTPGTSPSGTPAPAASPNASGTPSKGTAKKGTPAKSGKPGAPSGAATPQGTPSGPASSPAGTTGAATPPVFLSGLQTPLSGGENVRLTLHFQQAGALTISVPVLPRADYYGTYPPAPSGTTATTPSPATTGSPATPAASPTPGATGSPSAGAVKPTKHPKGKKSSAKPGA